MTKKEALNKIKELELYIENLNKSVGFEDDKIFLLSAEEYTKYTKFIPYIKTRWWLRSEGYSSHHAETVGIDSEIDEYGTSIDGIYGAVRPALRYTNLNCECFDSKDYDCFIWKEIKWKIIDRENEIAISCLPIGFEKFDTNSNNYKNSHIRSWLNRLI